MLCRWQPESNIWYHAFVQSFIADIGGTSLGSHCCDGSLTSMTARRQKWSTSCVTSAGSRYQCTAWLAGGLLTSGEVHASCCQIGMSVHNRRSPVLAWMPASDRTRQVGTHGREEKLHSYVLQRLDHQYFEPGRIPYFPDQRLYCISYVTILVDDSRAIATIKQETRIRLRETPGVCPRIIQASPP